MWLSRIHGWHRKDESREDRRPVPNLEKRKMFVCRINSKSLLFSLSCWWEETEHRNALASLPRCGEHSGQARAGRPLAPTGLAGASLELGTSCVHLEIQLPASGTRQGVSQSLGFSQDGKYGMILKWPQAPEGPQEGWTTQGSRMWFP